MEEIHWLSPIFSLQLVPLRWKIVINRDRTAYERTRESYVWKVLCSDWQSLRELVSYWGTILSIVPCFSKATITFPDQIGRNVHLFGICFIFLVFLDEGANFTLGSIPCYTCDEFSVEIEKDFIKMLERLGSLLSYPDTMSDCQRKEATLRKRLVGVGHSRFA